MSRLLFCLVMIGRSLSLPEDWPGRFLQGHGLDTDVLIDAGIETPGIALLDGEVLHAPRHPKRSRSDRRCDSGGSSVQALPATTLGNQPSSAVSDQIEVRCQ